MSQPSQAATLFFHWNNLDVVWLNSLHLFCIALLHKLSAEKSALVSQSCALWHLPLPGNSCQNGIRKLGLPTLFCCCFSSFRSFARNGRGKKKTENKSSQSNELNGISLPFYSESSQPCPINLQLLFSQPFGNSGSQPAIKKQVNNEIAATRNCQWRKKTRSDSET